MGGWTATGISLLAVFSLWGTGHPIWVSFAVAAAVLNFWSHGVMHNHAMRSAKDRHDRLRRAMVEGGASQEELDRMDTKIINIDCRDADSAPDWLVWVNLPASLAGLVLLIVGIVVRLR